MTINKKILGLFLAWLVIFIIFAASASLVIRSFSRDLREAITVSRKVNLTGSLQFQTNKLLTPINQYLATGNIRERDHFDGIISNMSKLFSELKSFREDEQWQAVAARVEKEAIQLGEKAIAVLYMDNPVGNREARAMMSELNLLSDRLIKEADEFHKTSQREIAAMEGEVHRRIRTSIASAAAILAVLLFSAAMLYYYLKTFVTMPIRSLHEGASIFARGNLSHRLHVKTGDELEELADKFNDMAKEIEARTREMRKLSLALEQSINIAFITDKTGNIEYVNPMFEQTTGWSKEEAIGRNPRILASGETPRVEYEELWNTILQGKTFRGALKNRKKDGQFFWVNSQIAPIRDEKGEITHFLAMQEDITAKKKAEEKAEYLGRYDELTGLINRGRFMELLQKWMESDDSKKRTGVLLLIDIDGFKFINDTYGHLMGDNFLQRAALFLKSIICEKTAPALRETIAARLGADEFALFIQDIDGKAGESLAEHIRKRFENFRPLEEAVKATVSIGIALYPEHGRETKELLSRVDIAMYRAKKEGRNRRHLYQPEDRDLEKIHSRLREKERIQNALAENRFEPWFQPIMDLSDNKIHHYEALARMRNGDGTILLPGSFIETAEIFGLVGAIDRSIMEKTLQLHADIHRWGQELSFSINLSGKDLEDRELLAFLQSLISEKGVDPDHLIFEITETAAIHDMARALRFIAGLKSLGCLFSLDDFGVGFTSFVYLKEMQVDYIKIDGSFIKNLPRNQNDRLIVKAITDVARGMGIRTIAEFVSEEQTIDLLKQLRVDYAQGYAVGKPAPWSEIKF